MANGVNVTVSADGSLRLSGTATAAEVASWAQDRDALAGKTLILSQSGVPDGYSFCIVERTSDGVPTVRNAGEPFQLAESTATVYLSLRCADLSKAADASRVLVQLEEGEEATEWQRPDVIDWGGVASPVNLWRPVEAGTKSGVTCTVGADGSISLAGSNTGESTVYFNSARITTPLPTGPFSLAGASISARLNINLYDAGGSRVPVSGGSIPEHASWNCFVAVDAGKPTGMTLWPMLETGSTAHPYVPYPMGGGYPADQPVG